MEIENQYNIQRQRWVAFVCLTKISKMEEKMKINMKYRIILCYIKRVKVNYGGECKIALEDE